MPEVTIVVPSYNRADLIGETLDSIVRQDYPNWECLIVDDHSTDSTADVCSTYVTNDPRFRYLLNARSKGAQGARNTGIDQAAGRYLIFLDSDDLLSDTCLSSRLASVSQHPGYDYYCFATGVFQEKPGDTPFLWNYLNKDESDLVRFIKQDMPWHTSGVLWTREALKLLDGWDEAISCWQDWDVHLRALANPNLRYWKSSDEAVDSFYRKTGTYNAISNVELSTRSMDSKLYLLDKFKNLTQLSAKIKIEFARLVYRMAYQVAESKGKREALQFLRTFLYPIGLPRLYTRSWYLYFDYKFYSSRPSFVKKAFGVIPRIYKNNSLLENNRTHLKASLS